MHDGVLVVIGANNSLRVLGGSYSPISAEFSKSDSKLLESAGEFGGHYRFSLVVFSILESKVVSSRFKDLQLSMQTTIKN